MTVLLVQLLQVAVGVRDSLLFVPTAHDWMRMFDDAKVQCVAGVAFYGVNRLYQQHPEQVASMPDDIKMQWHVVAEYLKAQNGVVNGAIRKLLRDERLADCHKVILKGQAVAKYYPCHELRNAGDIDIWCVRHGMSLKESLKVMAHRALDLMPGAGVQPHHTDWPVVDGVRVELHFTPSMVYSFWYNRRVQRYFEEILPNCQGYRLPIEADVVFQLIHLRRHLIDEGVGLRQVMDLYWTVKAYASQRTDELKHGKNLLLPILKRLGLASFAEAMMWVLQEVFLMSDNELICHPDKKRGAFVLSEVLKGGNFGIGKAQHHNTGKGRVRHLWYYTRLAMRCFRYFPHESVCAPIYRAYLWQWKKKFKSKNN